MSHGTRPRFTIVTSTFNVVDLLPLTAASLAEQTLKHFEWIIVDGASTDGTVDLVLSLGSQVDHFISEPDNGIYAAWNKALPLIKGDWVLFLGAGDSLFDACVLERASVLLSQLPDSVTTAFGDVWVFSDDGGPETLRRGEWVGPEGPWVAGRPVLPCHQGVFQRSGVLREFAFDARCRISADNEVLLKELLPGHGQRIDLEVARFHAGGVSAQRKRRLRMVLESVYINYKVGLFGNRPFYQLAVVASNAVKHVLRMLGARSI